MPVDGLRRGLALAKRNSTKTLTLIALQHVTHRSRATPPDCCLAAETDPPGPHTFAGRPSLSAVIVQATLSRAAMQGDTPPPASHAQQELLVMTSASRSVPIYNRLPLDAALDMRPGITGKSRQDVYIGQMGPHRALIVSPSLKRTTATDQRPARRARPSRPARQKAKYGLPGVAKFRASFMRRASIESSRHLGSGIVRLQRT